MLQLAANSLWSAQLSVLDCRLADADTERAGWCSKTVCKAMRFFAAPRQIAALRRTTSFRPTPERD